MAAHGIADAVPRILALLALRYRRIAATRAA